MRRCVQTFGLYCSSSSVRLGSKCVGAHTAHLQGFFLAQEKHPFMTSFIAEMVCSVFSAQGVFYVAPKSVILISSDQSSFLHISDPYISCGKLQVGHFLPCFQLLNNFTA
ncbi:hypothetical protein ILYODFUR_021614 [Ilyodon furcidens]|uniref:Uncharacterized protein n=1 Tax=Ilyodon furcidens TaxID=33524 RepID=A0ABV0VG38_9TELE